MIKILYAACGCQVRIGSEPWSLCNINHCIKHGKQYHLGQDELRTLIRQTLGIFNCQANDEAIDKMIEEFLPCQSKV